LKLIEGVMRSIIKNQILYLPSAVAAASARVWIFIVRFESIWTMKIHTLAGFFCFCGCFNLIKHQIRSSKKHLQKQNQIFPSALAEARVRVSIFYLWIGMFVITFLSGLMPIIV